MDEEHEQALGSYGRHVGLAFQLVDDLLDFVGDPETLGKPAVSDLREGKATLAVLDLLSGSPGEEALARRVMDEPESADAIEALSAKLHESGAIERTHERARFHARSAVGALRMFPDGPAKRALEALPDILLARDR
jgi:octaprenyl-diphosphate synthase